jgi:hypothetical protein
VTGQPSSDLPRRTLGALAMPQVKGGAGAASEGFFLLARASQADAAGASEPKMAAARATARSEVLRVRVTAEFMRHAARLCRLASANKRFSAP